MIIMHHHHPVLQQIRHPPKISLSLFASSLHSQSYSQATESSAFHFYKLAYEHSYKQNHIICSFVLYYSVFCFCLFIQDNIFEINLCCACISTFILIAEYYCSFVQTYYVLYIHSPNNGLSDFFCFLFIMNNAAINIWVQTFFFLKIHRCSFLLLNIYLFILAVIAAYGLYLVAASGGYSLAVVCRLLIALSSRVIKFYLLPPLLIAVECISWFIPYDDFCCLLPRVRPDFTS